jgi:drug/metabolite transporter (DMT)-like permease
MVWEVVTTPINWSFGWEIWAGVLYVGVISTTVAFYLWNKGFEMVQAGSGAVFFFFQPIVGTLFGWLLLGEQLSVSFFIGAVCILVGVGFSNRQKQK